MINILIGICLISFICLVVFLAKLSFRKKKNIISSILVILVSLLLIVAVKNYQDKVEDELKVKEEQAERKKVEAEQKEKEEQEKAKQKAREEAEQEIKDEESLKMNNINTAKEQLLGKRYFIAPSLYDGVDANKAMTEKKAPQNLMHDGGKNVTFTNENTVHIELAGTYRPDMDMNYTLTENTVIIGQDNIPYSINDGIVSFGTWTTDWGGHTVTWSITKNS